MTVRFYSSVALQTALTSGITASATSIQVASTTGFPGATPFVLALDYGAANEELVDVTGVAALTLTVTRAVDGTSASTHNAGAVVRHVSSGRDFSDSRTHENASTGIHGLAGGSALVGTNDTQILSNKTLNRATGTLQRIDIFNTGVWQTTVVGDSTQPTLNKMAFLDNEVSLQEVMTVNADGGLISNPRTGATDTNLRFRSFDPDRTTERLAMFQGGGYSTSPNATTTAPAFWCQDNGNSTSKAAILIGNVGGGSGYLTTFRDGHTLISPPSGSTGVNPLQIKAPASITVDMFRVVDSTSTAMASVQSTGLLLANRGATIARTGLTSGTLLTAGATNAGYTGNLQAWVGPGGATVGTVNHLGDVSFAGIGGEMFAFKAADTNRASTTTFADDPDLQFTAVANAVYKVTFDVHYAALDAARIKTQWNVTATTTGVRSSVGPDQGVILSGTSSGGTGRWGVHAFTTASTYGTRDSGTNQCYMMEESVITVGATGGTIALQWAQATSNATATKVAAGSFMRVTRLA